MSQKGDRLSQMYRRQMESIYVVINKQRDNNFKTESEKQGGIKTQQTAERKQKHRGSDRHNVGAKGRAKRSKTCEGEL